MILSRINFCLRLCILAISPFVFGLAGCSSPQASSESPPKVYTVRGVVKQLPIEGNRNAELLIRHEAIPNFENETGTVVGMMSMTMPFNTTPML